MTAVGTGVNNGQAMVIQGAGCRKLMVLWCSETEVCGMMCYGDPGGCAMPEQDPQGNAIELLANRDESSLKGMPLSTEDWAVQLCAAIQEANLAWIYPQFNDYMKEKAFPTPASFEVWMKGIGIAPGQVVECTCTVEVKPAP